MQFSIYIRVTQIFYICITLEKYFNDRAMSKSIVQALHRELADCKIIEVADEKYVPKIGFGSVSL